MIKTAKSSRIGPRVRFNIYSPTQPWRGLTVSTNWNLWFIYLLYFYLLFRALWRPYRRGFSPVSSPSRWAYLWLHIAVHFRPSLYLPRRQERILHARVPLSSANKHVCFWGSRFRKTSATYLRVDLGSRGSYRKQATNNFLLECRLDFTAASEWSTFPQSHLVLNKRPSELTGRAITLRDEDCSLYQPQIQQKGDNV